MKNLGYQYHFLQLVDLFTFEDGVTRDGDSDFSSVVSTATVAEEDGDVS